MFNSAILDVAIALAFTYLLLALICTTISEWLAGILKTRGRMLEQGIRGMLGNQKLGNSTFAELFDAHPLIAAMRQDPRTPPSYLAPRTFALTVMDLVTQPGSITFADLENGIKTIPDGCVKQALLAAIQNAEGSLPKAQAGIENWFNDTMDRVSGWFTRRKQCMSVVLAIGVTLFANADTLAIANKLWLNPTLRQGVLARAEKEQPALQRLMSATYPDADQPKNPKVNRPDESPFKTATALYRELGDLTGWDSEFHVQYHGSWQETLRNSYRHAPGWLLTIVAVSMGAPFWFDTLNRFMNLRSAGKNPSERKKGPEKDVVVEARA